MPLYDFRCRTCDETFEVRRPMAEADEPATCPQGHTDTLRLLPIVSLGGRAEAPAQPAPAGGCGAGCVCHPAPA
ncbi:MAG TPA: zinc ribbon domain-containing protein [Acidimicrobiales bacterium]